MINANFWNDKYINHQTGWDLGEVSPPIKQWADSFDNKKAKILIPGCGNAHEAEYLLKIGFQDLTLIDISHNLVENLKKKFENETRIKVICDDFFNLTNKYDVVIEQTFFCALNPELRTNYVLKMKEILNPNGILIGVLFNRQFEGGPPFGGDIFEYQKIFSPSFKINTMRPCLNSIKPRQGSELWVEMQVKKK